MSDLLEIKKACLCCFKKLSFLLSIMMHSVVQPDKASFAKFYLWLDLKNEKQWKKIYMDFGFKK